MPFIYNPQTGTLDAANTGNVVGPSSSVDLVTARYSGTTGKLLLGPKVMQVYEEMDDFIIGSAQSNGSFPYFNTGTGSTVGAITNSAALNGHPGINFLRTGTDTNGYAFMYHGGNTVSFGSSCTYIIEVMLYIPVAISDITDEYQIYAGFNDTITGPATDGAYFQYNRIINTNWSAVTADNGTRTSVDTGVAVSAAAWTKLKVINDGTNSYFYVNDTLTNTVATNNPSGGARATSFALCIAKTAGTTSRDLYCDYAYHANYCPSR